MNNTNYKQLGEKERDRIYLLKEKGLTNVFKEMENKCKEDYKKVEGNFPEWNYQERAIPWPKKIHESYVKFLTKRVKKR